MSEPGRLTIRLGPLEAKLAAAAAETGLSAYAIAQLILAERLAGGIPGLHRAALILLLTGWADALRTLRPASDTAAVGDTLGLRLPPDLVTALDRSRGTQARSPWAAAVIAAGLAELDRLQALPPAAQMKAVARGRPASAHPPHPTRALGGGGADRQADLFAGPGAAQELAPDGAGGRARRRTPGP